MPCCTVCRVVVTLCALVLLHAADAPVAVGDDPVLARGLAVGSAAPREVLLHRSDGSEVRLEQVLAEGPTLIVFYRGGWCPFCTRHLAGIGAILPELHAAGVSLVAIVPDQPSVLAQAPADDGVLRLSDANGSAMRAYGVAFHVDDATAATLAGFGIDLAAASGQQHRWLPVPSVFLIDSTGSVRFVHADPDYRRRLDPQVLLALARTMTTTAEGRP